MGEPGPPLPSLLKAPMGTVRQPGSGCGVRGRPSLRMRAFLGGLLPTFGAAQLTRGDALGAQTRCAARRCPLRPAAPPHGARRLCSPPKATFQGCSPTSPRITLTVGGGTSARRVSAGHRGDGPVPPGCSPTPSPRLPLSPTSPTALRWGTSWPRVPPESEHRPHQTQLWGGPRVPELATDGWRQLADTCPSSPPCSCPSLSSPPVLFRFPTLSRGPSPLQSPSPRAGRWGGTGWPWGGLWGPFQQCAGCRTPKGLQGPWPHPYGCYGVKAGAGLCPHRPPGYALLLGVVCSIQALAPSFQPKLIPGILPSSLLLAPPEPAATRERPSGCSSPASPKHLPALHPIPIAAEWERGG